MIESQELLDAILAEITAAIDLAVQEGHKLHELGKLCGCSGSFLSQIRSGRRGPGITFIKLVGIHQGLHPWTKKLTTKPLSSILANMDIRERAICQLLYDVMLQIDQVQPRNLGRLEQLLQTIKDDDLSSKTKPSKS